MKNLIYFFLGFALAVLLGVGWYYFNKNKHHDKGKFEQTSQATAKGYTDSFKKEFPKVKSEFYVSKDLVKVMKHAYFSLKGEDKDTIYGFKISYGLIEDGDSTRIISVIYPAINHNVILNEEKVYISNVGKILRAGLPCPPFCDKEYTSVPEQDMEMGN